MPALRVEGGEAMSKLTHAFALTAGCAIGILAMAVIYAQCFFRTCENLHESGGFECSWCHSHTDYHPKTPFNFCPICGAYCGRRGRI